MEKARDNPTICTFQEIAQLLEGGLEDKDAANHSMQTGVLEHMCTRTTDKVKECFQAYPYARDVKSVQLVAKDNDPWQTSIGRSSTNIFASLDHLNPQSRRGGRSESAT